MKAVEVPTLTRIFFWISTLSGPTRSGSTCPPLLWGARIGRPLSLDFAGTVVIDAHAQVGYIASEETIRKRCVLVAILAGS